MAIFLIIMMGLSAIALVIGILLSVAKVKTEDGTSIGAITNGVSGTLLVLFGLFLFFCSFAIIDAGEVGVEVLWGEVQEKTLTEGWQSKSIFSSIVTYNIRLREYTMSSATDEGAVTGNDVVTIRTSNNSEMGIECTVIWAINPMYANKIYKSISVDDDGIEEILIRPTIRSLLRDIGATYTLDSIMQLREEYGGKVFIAMEDSLESKGLLIDKVLIREISPPESVDRSIETKLKAEQDLAKKQFELEMAEKDADILRIEAQGIADAQKIIQEKLTPIYVQYLAVKNYEKMAESENNTFIIAPTSPNGTGMPIIIGQ